MNIYPLRLPIPPPWILFASPPPAQLGTVSVQLPLTNSDMVRFVLAQLTFGYACQVGSP